MLYWNTVQIAGICLLWSLIFRSSIFHLLQLVLQSQSRIFRPVFMWFYIVAWAAVLSIAADGRQHSRAEHTMTGNRANTITVASQTAVLCMELTKRQDSSLLSESAPHNWANKYEWVMWGDMFHTRLSPFLDPIMRYSYHQHDSSYRRKLIS